jgi:hypothetical protein
MRTCKPHIDANEDNESDEDGISRGLVRLVSRCLDAAPVDVCVESVNQLSSQLQVFTDASPYRVRNSIRIKTLFLPDIWIRCLSLLDPFMLHNVVYPYQFIGSYFVIDCAHIYVRVSILMSAYGRLSALPSVQNGPSNLSSNNPTLDSFVRSVFPQTLLTLAARPLVTCGIRFC